MCLTIGLLSFSLPTLSRPTAAPPLLLFSCRSGRPRRLFRRKGGSEQRCRVMAGHRLPYSRLYTHATSVILAPFRLLHPRKAAFHYAPNISYRNLRLSHDFPPFPRLSPRAQRFSIIHARALLYSIDGISTGGSASRGRWRANNYRIPTRNPAC